MPQVRWAELKEMQLSNSARARVVKTKNVMACRITAPKGVVTATHTHPFDQITHILRGKMRFHVAEEAYRVAEEGDILVVPAGTPHGGEVLEEAEYIDFFSALNPMFSED